MKVEPISVLTIGEKTHAVSGCSDTVKQLVDVLNEWRQKEVDTRSDLMLVQAGIRDLQREIVNTVQAEEQQAAEAAAAAEAANAEEAPAVEAPASE